ncbi:MAG: DUF1249 domain-containing protein [Gammaproteobacteria bacterium]|nr:DUF1249 domain-containing protein [Gammaproteobacteria bacterium]
MSPAGSKLFYAKRYARGVCLAGCANIRQMLYTGPDIASLTRESHSLSRLIHVYESNFVRLMRLIPSLDEFEGSVKSRVADAMDLYLSIHERTRYTTTLSLTYRFESDAGLVLEPNARIRVYHDVRSVELLYHTRRRLRRVTAWRPGRRRPELERKWEMNRFLQKWLGFCQRQGHVFLNGTAVNVDPRLLDLKYYSLFGEGSVFGAGESVV